jgi:hypothetical protein
MNEPDAMPTVEQPPSGNPPAPPDGEKGESPEERAKKRNRKIVKHFRSRLKASERNTDNFKTEWKRNVDLRLGRPDQLYTAGIDMGSDDDNQTSINPDWSLTKTKTANLFSQVPGVIVTHENDQYAPAIGPFTKELNYEISDKRAKTGAAMREAVNDIVNAAGIAGIVIGYAARFETVDVPVRDEDAQFFQQMAPEQQQQVIQQQLVPMRKVQRTVGSRFYTNRISPLDVRVPAEFKGSDFNQGPWVGYAGRMPWADALHELGLKEEDKEAAIGGGNKASEETTLQSQPDEEGLMDLDSVSYTKLYYWRYLVDPDEVSFDAIWVLVFVDGMDEPTVHRPWKGQQWNPKTRQFAGARKFPVQVGAITYVSDNPIPPSDSSAGRPQVNDLRRSRSQMFMNRDRSVPIRGFNSAAVDPDVRDLLMRGDYQGMIPFNGNQREAMWEVARASYPAEDLSFDRQTMADLITSWGQQLPSQVDSGAPKSKSEVTVTQQAMSTVMGQERAMIASFFLNVVEVLAGLMALYSDFTSLTPQERQAMQQAWPMKDVNPDLTLTIRPDSMITLAPEQRLQRLSQFLNLTVKSGLINPTPILVEMTELTGLDPALIIKKPDPPRAPEAKIALRLNGKHDVQNPLMMAILAKGGHMPNDQELDQAKVMLLKAQNPNPSIPPPPPGQPGQPPSPGGPPPGPLNQAHKQWSLASKISKRSRDAGQGGGNPGSAA